MKALRKELSLEIITNGAQVVNRKRKHIATGTRKLAPLEAQLRTLSAMGLTHGEIATTISKTLDLGVTAATLKQYVSAACAELSIHRPRKVTVKAVRAINRAAAARRLNQYFARFMSKRGK